MPRWMRCGSASSTSWSSLTRRTRGCSVSGTRLLVTRCSVSLLPFELIELSRRVLGAIESQYPDLPGSLCELAATLAELIDDRPRAAELLLLAARRAYATGALSSTGPMLDRAWASTDPSQAIWHEIGRLLVQVLRTSGDVDRALEAGTRLLASSTTPDQQVNAHLEIARAATTAVRWDEAARPRRVGPPDLRRPCPPPRRP